MIDAASRLRSATTRAKSDVANKLISMFLHELSRSVSKTWMVRLGSAEYGSLVREFFGHRCPYCLCALAEADSVVEHLDGMNRYRAGLHVPGNVLVACRRCNSEKRRDDSLKVLSLAASGWASFLSHDGVNCAASCKTCRYWRTIWSEDAERNEKLRENLERIVMFRSRFPEFQAILPELAQTLPTLLTKLYSDCQTFAETEIRTLLNRFQQTTGAIL
jgi:hypothetical protein